LRSRAKSYVAITRVLFLAGWLPGCGSNASAYSLPSSSRLRKAGCLASMPVSTTATRTSELPVVTPQAA
jgi:hypothetical protein